MLTKEEVNWQLDAFNLGAATAEKDPLLETARIETQEFYDLYLHDRIDIIRGIKGAGKTALYRLFWFIRQHMIEKKGIHCIFGIEATGDPIFRQYQSDFATYNEIEFENFWGLYFIVLVYQTICVDEALRWKVGLDEIQLMDKKLKEIGIIVKCGSRAEIRIGDSALFINKKYSNRSLKQILDYVYDANDQLDLIKEGTTTIADFDYDVLGRRSTKTTSSILHTTYSYDSANQLTSPTNILGDDGGLVSKYQYPEYDQVGNRNGKSQTFIYDKNCNLTPSIFREGLLIINMTHLIV